ncbi:MAG TPA: hypothetical protein VM141_10045 [Planctomycetota bacterium]|nr:hypothetical protein [Planctomycetota bacterium]
MLEFKPDWEKTKERYRAWWAGEIVDRCAIAAYAWKPEGPPPPAPPSKIEDRWLDHDYIAALNDYNLRHTFYGGEALPIWHPGYPGWNTIAVFLGSNVTLKEDTAWVEPLIPEGSLADYDCSALVIDPSNESWQRSLRMQRHTAAQARGRSIPTTGAFGGCGDTLAWLRGSSQLLIDLVECPECVMKFEMQLMKQWCEVYDALHAITRKDAEGSAGWFELWSPGKFYAAQNDFSYMISPKMFRKIFLPAIEMQTNFLDHTIYHVDGVASFAHVPALCELPRLHALQILPGAGKPSPLHYIDVLKTVQAAEKNLHISIPPGEVETALRELSPRGLFIHTWCPSESDARDLLGNVEKWSL